MFYVFYLLHSNYDANEMPLEIKWSSYIHIKYNNLH